MLLFYFMFGFHKNKKQEPKINATSNIPLDESKLHTMKDDLEGGEILEKKIDSQEISGSAQLSETVSSSESRAQARKLQSSSPFVSAPSPQSPKDTEEFSQTSKVAKKPLSHISRDDLHKQLEKLDKGSLQTESSILQQKSNSFDSKIPSSSEQKKEEKSSPNMPLKDFHMTKKGSKNFFSKNSGGDQETGKILTQKPVESTDNTVEKKEVSKDGKDISSLIFYIVVPLVVVLLLGSGGYYYWKTRIQEPEPIVIIEPEDSNPIEPIEPVEPVEDKYSQLDLNEIVFSEDDRMDDVLMEIKEEIMQYDSQGLYEFYFVKDEQGLEVVPSSELLSQLGMSLDGAFVENLAEVLSVYIYKDQSGIRLGLSIELVDRDMAEKALLENESGLFQNAHSIFLGEVVNTADITFSDSVYRTYAIRYKNLNQDETTSIDYAFRRNSLVIGTSKNTIREVLDALDGENGE